MAERDLELLDTYSLPAGGSGVHTWEEGGNRLIVVVHGGVDFYVTLLEWDGASLSEKDTHTLPDSGRAVHTWEEDGDRLIAASSTAGDRFFLLRWDGTSLSEVDSYEMPGTVEDIHSWEEGGDRLIATAHFSDARFTLLRWDGTSLSEVDTYSLGGTGYSTYTWEENGDRLIAVGHARQGPGDPNFSILKWDGESLSRIYTHDTPATVRGLYAWEEGDDVIIAAAHTYLHLYRWDGVSMSEEAVYDNLPGTGQSVRAWEENGVRFIPVGHDSEPYFTLLEWDGTSLTVVETYTFSDDVYGVSPWTVSGGALIPVVTHASEDNLALLSYTVPAAVPILSAEQDNAQIHLTWTYE